MKDIFVGTSTTGPVKTSCAVVLQLMVRVDRVSIVTDRYSGHPGSAFVEMASARDADRAITELMVLNSTAARLESMRRRRGPGAPTGPDRPRTPQKRRTLVTTWIASDD